jgi:hypothetical protein
MPQSPRCLQLQYEHAGQATENSSRYLWACRFERNSYFFCIHEGTADVPVFGIGVERDQSVAMLAIRLVFIADILRPLPEYLRAFCAFDFDFIVNHGTPQKLNGHSPL